MDPNFPGDTGLDSLGEVLNCGGSDSFECLIYRRGTIFRPRLSGMLVKNDCILLGNVEICGRMPDFLKVDNMAWLEENILLAGSLSGELRCLVMFLSLPWHLGGWNN